MLVVREESDTDFVGVYALVKEAFAPMPYAGGDEQDLVNILRELGALRLALVAELDGELVGHIAFSPARALDPGQVWWALGPVAVAPKYQGQGIGGQLITEGLQRATAAGAVGCVLTGNPAYYRRFGFELAPDHVPPQESAEYFMLKTLADVTPTGPIAFHEAFYGN